MGEASNEPWDYTIFGERGPAPKPDDVIPLVIRRSGVDKAGFEQWTINGKHYDAANPPTRLTKGGASASYSITTQTTFTRSTYIAIASS